jgi:hypothetical protein
MLLCSVASQQTIFLHSFHTSPPHIESTESLSASQHTKLTHKPSIEEKKIMAKQSLHWPPPLASSFKDKLPKKGDGHITMQQSIKS